MSRSKVRVALCTDGVFPHALGGMQRHSRLLAEHLAKHDGIELVVLHPHGIRVFDPSHGITEVRLAPIDPERLYLLQLWRYSDRVAKALEGIGPDVVLAQGYSVWSGISRWTNRLVVMPHGLEMFQGLTRKDRAIGAPFRAALKYVVRHARTTVSLGGKLTGLLEVLVDGTPGRVVVVPNAVEIPEAPVSYPPVDGPLNILFVGRFAFNKGIDVLLAVAARLQAEGRGRVFQFVLAGDGPLRTHMEEHGLPANVSMAGTVDDAGLEELYASCHALLLPTRFEGMPTVVLEAMARSRPVIVSDVGATAELVTAENGFLLPPGDAEALHAALLKFAALSHDDRSTLGTIGRRIAAERFSWPSVTERFVALIQKLAQKPL